MSNKELLTTNDIMDIFSISYRTVWYWKEGGVLPPAVRFSRRCYWKRADIENMIESGAVR